MDRYHPHGRIELARIRVLGTSGPQLASQPEPPVETQDVAPAVRLVEHCSRASLREVLAQQAADTNSEPMPILPRRTGVLCRATCRSAYNARRLRAWVEDDDDELDGLGVDSEPAQLVAGPSRLLADADRHQRKDGASLCCKTAQAPKTLTGSRCKPTSYLRAAGGAPALPLCRIECLRALSERR